MFDFNFSPGPQSNFGKISASFAGPFDRAAVATHERFFNPFYRITEWLLPSGARLRRDIKDVKRFGDELVREGRERLRRQEEGLDENEDEEGKAGKGILLEELVKERGGDDQVRFLADSCLNFLTAGEHPVRHCAVQSRELKRAMTYI